MDEAQEEGGVVFVAHDQPTEVEQPTDRPLDFPAVLVATQLATVLSVGPLAASAVRADEFDATMRQPLAQRIAVSGSIVNQPLLTSAQNPPIQEWFDQRDFTGAGAGDVGRQRRS